MDRQPAPFKLRCPYALVPDERGCVKEAGTFLLFGQGRKTVVVRIDGTHEQFLPVKDRTIAPIRVATQVGCSPTQVHILRGGKSRMGSISDSGLQEQGLPEPSW